MPPRERAARTRWDPDVQRWRFASGPRKGAFAPPPPSGGRDQDQFYYHDRKTGTWKKTGVSGSTKQNQAIGRNKVIERNAIVRGLAEESGRSFREVQRMMSGLSLSEIRGKFLGLTRLGVPQYGDMSDKMAAILDRLGIIGDPHALKKYLETA